MENMNISIVCALRDMNSKERVISNIGGNAADEAVFVEGKNPSLQRNAGVAAARGGLIYFMDDDSIVPDGVLRKAAEQFEADSALAVLGGPELTPEGDSQLQKVFGYIFSSVFAAGSSAARYSSRGKRRESGEKELILCNMFVRKDVFLEYEGFNVKLYPNEENEFLIRVKEGGGRIIYDPELYIYRSKRKSFREFIKQCFGYGRGRAEQSVAAFDTGALVNFIPAFFVIYILSEIFLGAAEIFPMLLYAALNIGFSAGVAVKLKDISAGFLAAAGFLALHLSYGCGTLYGLYTGFNLKDKTVDDSIKIEVIALR
jgi:GT2 family glycosyltransferase